MSGQAHMLSQTNVVEPIPEHAVGPPGKKRQRGGAQAPKKRHRGRKVLIESNPDELYIILEYVYPMDLLNLARTCKSLRRILMQKSISSLWRTALSRIQGLPPCPADLTEPEYTNLVFYNCCHSCGKYAKGVFWSLRRRYCPACRDKRLVLLHRWDKLFSLKVLPNVESAGVFYADGDQMRSFVREYNSSSDKKAFLSEKQKQYKTISSHATECDNWRQQQGRVQRFDLEVLRKERQASILERLRQCGYGPEIAYFGDKSIGDSFKSVFKKPKPLDEWDQMWPEWAKIMDDLRMKRLGLTVYQPRRLSLASEYDEYVTQPSPDSPALDFLPHVVDLACFPLFRNIIRAPEGTHLDDKLFASAFAQLPALADEWTRKLNSEVAGLVRIPSCPPSAVVSRGPNEVVSHEGLPQTDLDRLHLACAVFYTDRTGAFVYPEVLSVPINNGFFSHNNHSNVSLESDPCDANLERTGSFCDRFGLRFLDEAPYIVYACGLDPNVATADDMDRRNARLTCLICVGRTPLMNWKRAILHARFSHRNAQVPLSESPRWQRVDDRFTSAIQAVERTAQRSLPPDLARCLLCRPRIGDAMSVDSALDHLAQCHGLERRDIKEGMHYKFVGIYDY